jgi:16S rRNA (guanine527-N7)-methyltransferase
LVPGAALHRGSRVLDVGSGAGFPGIPLALLRPDVDFVLAERRSKRRAFLQSVAASVAAHNVTVTATAEEARPYDVVLGRAVMPLRDWLSYATGLVGPGGQVGLFAQESAEDPTAVATALGLHTMERKNYALPDESRRRFWWFERLVPRETD